MNLLARNAPRLSLIAAGLLIATQALTAGHFMAASNTTAVEAGSPVFPAPVKSVTFAETLDAHNATIEADTASIAAARAAVSEAQAALTDSEARVLDNNPRVALAEAIAAATARVDAAQLKLDATKAKLIVGTASAGPLVKPVTSTKEGVATVAADLQADVSAVQEAVAVWTVEQERIAAEAAAAAAEQAEAEAAAAAASASSSSGNSAPAASSGDYVKHVWAAGFQDELDVCNGGVDHTGVYGVAVVGEHWSCGGSSFPREAGTVVTFTGAVSGTYRVEGAAGYLNAHTDTAASIPRGYDLLFQTCMNGDSSNTVFVGLTRIG